MCEQTKRKEREREREAEKKRDDDDAGDTEERVRKGRDRKGG